MIRQSQVVLLICGLMSDPTPVIDLVWINGGHTSAGKTLIESIFLEAGLPVPKIFCTMSGSTTIETMIQHQSMYQAEGIGSVT